MAKRFSYYYLQVNTGLTWETLEQSESVTVLTGGLADQLASPTDAEIRIVGANFDEASENWVYEQLFYIDQSSIDLGISEDPDEEGADLPPAGASGWDEPSDHRISEPEARDDGESEFSALLREREEPDDSGYADEPEVEDELPPRRPVPAPESEEESAPSWGGFDDETTGGDASDDIENDEHQGSEEVVPWLRARTGASQVEPDRSEPFRFDDTPPPRRRRSIGKIIGFLFLLLFLSVFVVIGALVYLQHPFVMQTADKFGIGSYLRMMSHHGETMSEHHEKPLMTPSGAPQVEPLTTGQVVRYVGVAPALRGRWSPRKCETTYIEFDENGYVRSIDGQISAAKTEISESLEDDFVFYLRRSPELVEHYRKVTANDIQLAGATTESGFLGGSDKAEIYSRCR